MTPKKVAPVLGCTWTATCTHEAVWAVPHPILRYVPTCQEHAEMFGGNPAIWERFEVVMK